MSLFNRMLLAGFAWPSKKAVLGICLFLVTTFFGQWTQAGNPSARVDQRHRVMVLETLTLLINPQSGDGYIVLASRYGSKELTPKRLQELNGKRQIRLGREVGIPFFLLNADWQTRVLKAAFPKDKWDHTGITHKVGAAPLKLDGESLWGLSAWFTGRGRNYLYLVNVTQPGRERLRPGDQIFIPKKHLHNFLVNHLPEKPKPKEVVPPTHGLPDLTNDDGTLLSYGKDHLGDYAEYRLRSGEALYSAVVIRFTDLIHAADVNSAAFQIAARSGIEDVTDIKVSQPIKIPLTMLANEFLPPDSEERRSYNQLQEDLAEIDTQQSADNLEGVVVILDAGHGGIDRGAMANGVWEDDYVYDILCRIKERLETTTRARVLTTIMDPSVGYKSQDVKKFRVDHDEVILTHPWYNPASSGKSEIQVNLRWALANQYFSEVTNRGVEQEKVLFVSLHADALHPSVRGTMIYVPGARYAADQCNLAGPKYRGFKEANGTRAKFSKSEKIRAEAFSRQFSELLLKHLKKRQAPIHPHKPIRGNVVRKGREWIPAVIKCSQTYTRILWEVCNINNRQDAKNLENPDFRQTLAESFVDALLENYKQDKGFH